MELWTMLVVGNLLFPMEFHSDEACRTAAMRVSARLQATVLCLNPATGELVEYRNGELEAEDETDPPAGSSR